MSKRKLTDEEVKKILECFGIKGKQMIDTKPMAKHILEEYANYYSEVDIKELAKYLDGIKAEAIKEFAKRLKVEAIAEFDCDNCITGYSVDIDDIDNLVKEMVGDAE